MADHTISISNSINSFGPAPSTKWGTGTLYNMTWGSSKWGEGTIDLPVAVEKVLSSESIALSGAVFAFEVGPIILNSLAFTSETTSEGLQTANGWFYLFTGPTTEAESRNQSIYTSGSVSSASWTQASGAGGTWT
jgi:hypothetical protein